MWAIMDRTVDGGTVAKFSDSIPLLRVAVRKHLIGGEYTVTDAGISAGENVAGHAQQWVCKVGKTTIFDIQTDEIYRALELCNAVETEFGDAVMAPQDVTALYSDATPTTAQLQRFWAVLKLPHDYRLYDKAPKLVMKFRAATDEWGAASAYTGSFYCALETGNVKESAYLYRVVRGSSTKHSLEMGDDTVRGAIFFGPTVNTWTRVKIPGSDGTYEIDSDQATLGQAIYNMATGQAPADDDVDYQLFTSIASAPFAEREATVELSSAGTMTAFFYNVKATHAIAHNQSLGRASRGEADALTKVQNERNPVSSVQIIK